MTTRLDGLMVKSRVCFFMLGLALLGLRLKVQRSATRKKRVVDAESRFQFPAPSMMMMVKSQER